MVRSAAVVNLRRVNCLISSNCVIVMQHTTLHCLHFPTCRHLQWTIKSVLASEFFQNIFFLCFTYSEEGSALWGCLAVSPLPSSSSLPLLLLLSCSIYEQAWGAAVSSKAWRLMDLCHFSSVMQGEGLHAWL